MVYAEFGGQTECIMGNSKIENGVVRLGFQDLVSSLLSGCSVTIFRVKQRNNLFRRKKEILHHLQILTAQ